MAHHLHLESIEEMQEAGAFRSKETTLLVLINTHNKLRKTHEENAELSGKLAEAEFQSEKLSVELEKLKEEQHECRGELQRQIKRSNDLSAVNQEMERRLNDHDEKIEVMFRMLQGRENANSNRSEPERFYAFFQPDSTQTQEYRGRSSSISSSSSSITVSSELSSECRTRVCETETYEQRSVPPLPARNQAQQYKTLPPSGDVESSSDEEASRKKKSFWPRSVTKIKSLLRIE